LIASVTPEDPWDFLYDEYDEYDEEEGSNIVYLEREFPDDFKQITKV